MNTLMYALWFGILFIVFGGGFAYLQWRFLAPMKLAAPWNYVSSASLALLFLLPILSAILTRTNENLTDPFAWVTYVGLGLLSFVFTLVLARDAIWLISFLVAKGYIFVKSALGTTALPIIDTARRDFLLQVTNIGVLSAAGILTSYGIYEARRKPGIVNISVPIANLPKEFHGFKIVQITDIHAGLTVKRDWVEVIAREVEALKPDLLAFTGDMADGTVPHLHQDVEPLGELQAPHGKFFVTGNHEYYSGVEPWLEEAKRLGYDVLLNEHRVVKRNGSSLVLAGIPDPTGKQFLPETHTPNPTVALAGAPTDTVKILLAHQPVQIYDALPLGFDLMISGHTHGGQFFPWNLVAAAAQPYISGLHDHKGTWVYVSKGTGYWGPPVRLGARSEITVITLIEKSNT